VSQTPNLRTLLTLTESDDWQQSFKELQQAVLPVINQLAKENSQLKSDVENAQAENLRENGNSQLEKVLPEGFGVHPSNPQVPVRNKGQNGRPWSYYQAQAVDLLYFDDFLELAKTMANQGFLDTDILDAVFQTATGERRMSVHNWNGLLGVAAQARRSHE